MLKARKPLMSLDLSIKAELVQDNIPAKVIDNLWIGSVYSAFNQEALLVRHITHVLNCSSLPSTFPRTFTYLNVTIRDKEDANILSAFEATSLFIDKGIVSGGVLVHCAGGKSRSATFIAAYLINKRGICLTRAMEMIKNARSVVSINKGFEQQLKAYEASGFKIYEANQMLIRARHLRLVERKRRIISLTQAISTEDRSSVTNCDASMSIGNSLRKPSQLFIKGYKLKLIESEKKVSKESENDFIPNRARLPLIRISTPKTKAKNVCCSLLEMMNIYKCSVCGAKLLTEANLIDFSAELPDLSLISPLNVLVGVNKSEENNFPKKDAAQLSESDFEDSAKKNLVPSEHSFEGNEVHNNFQTSDVEINNLKSSNAEFIVCEYMSWMGDIVCAAGKEGVLFCPNQSCEALIGKWNWEDESFRGIPGPFIALNKGSVEFSINV